MRCKTYILFVLLTGVFGCGNEQDDLASELVSNGYLYYFTNANGIEARDSLSADKTAQELLKQIVSDSNMNSVARFIAAEILQEDTSKLFYDPGMTETISKIYTGGFTNAKYVQGKPENIWMLPCYTDDTIGDRAVVLAAGEHLLALGENAIPGLIEQLADTTRLYISMGSQREIFSDDLHFRVKDVAAFFICKIQGWEFNSCLSPVERDVEIEAIKEKLK